MFLLIQVLLTRFVPNFRHPVALDDIARTKRTIYPGERNRLSLVRGNFVKWILSAIAAARGGLSYYRSAAYRSAAYFKASL